MADAPKGKTEGTGWPSCRYGPDDSCAVFACEADVPKGWEDHPSKIKPAAKGKAPAKDEPALDL